MRALHALAVFIGTTIVLVVSMGALGGVGSIELLLAVALAAAITVLWLSRRKGSPGASTMTELCADPLPRSRT